VPHRRDEDATAFSVEGEQNAIVAEPYAVSPSWQASEPLHVQTRPWRYGVDCQLVKRGEEGPNDVSRDFLEIPLDPSVD
jgi:hypothetical protein